MSIRNKTESILLFLGDIILWYVLLWATLFLRYFSFPHEAILALHLPPFSLLFGVWALVFYIAGLYGKHTLILTSKLPTVVFNALLANSVIAVLFFYFVPFFEITPKTNLFIYLGLLFPLFLAWRLYGHVFLGFHSKHRALLVGSGSDMREFRDEVNSNRRYNITFISSFDLDKTDCTNLSREVIDCIRHEGIQTVVVDLHNPAIKPLLPTFYNLIFEGIRFIDMYRVYEDLFDRVPLSIMTHSWFLENISLSPRVAYDSFKRLMDIIAATFIGVLSLPLYPLVWLAVMLDDRGSLFIFQDRVGQNNRVVRLIKFRTMRYDDRGKWGDANYNRVTRAGGFLRRSRIDEFPQLWNVLRGDMSLIGPRPEFPDAVLAYEREIQYYGIRHLVKPGLSGWAQIHHDRHPHHAVDIVETKNKLSYDLYYVKNRSLMLDVKIALKTLKTFASRSGA